MATSLNAGIASIQHVADAVLIMLADQPLVSVDHLSVLACAWQRRPDAIVTSHYAGTDGPPVIFPRAFFAQLRALQGDRGAKRVIDANEEQVERVLFEPASVDIDRPQDLEALRS
jgi:CTP:molybdopterin cytidylyltransferase MocA